MDRRPKIDLSTSFSASLGWLFADMLLVLTILFIAANTFVVPKHPITPIHKSAPTPTPTVNALILDSQKERLIITGNDPDQLSQAKPDAIKSLEEKIRTQIDGKRFQNRRAGIEIVYGGANSFDQKEVNRSTSVATEVYAVLDMLGREGFVFCHSLHYDPPLFTRYYPDDTVIIDIYFFNSSIKNC